MTTTVLLIDDHALFRRGVAQLIEADPDLTVAAEASSGEEGLKLALKLQPDVVLVDLNMKGMCGLDTLRAIKAANVRACCVVLSVSDEERDVVDALRAGADGYLLKDLEPEDLCARLKSAVRGNIVLADGVANALAHALREPAAPPPHLQDLTEREREILQHISVGLSNKEIGRALGISDATVKVHTKNLLRKLHLKSRMEAALWTLRNTQRVRNEEGTTE